MSTGGLEYVLTENPQLNKTLGEYEMPVIKYGTINSDGYGMPAAYPSVSCELSEHSRA